jgi:DnaJ-class molecular chaperone
MRRPSGSPANPWLETDVAQDPYTELGVAKGASQPEIRKAFHKLAKQLHPDQNPGDKKGEERFKRVSAAFDFLSDEEKRKRFDRGEIDADGREVFRGFQGARGGGGQGGQPGAGPGGFGGRFEGADLDEIFSMFGGLGGGRRPNAPPARGVDVRARLEIDLEDTIVGGVKRIAFSDGRTVEVTIPKGATEGQVLRLKGQGAKGRGGAFGDAMIELVVRPHAIYRREGADLIMDLPVSVPDAVLGGKVEAPTPDGPVSLNVPKGSNSGSTLRLKGRGAFDAKTGKRGDLMARVMITLPDPIDSKLEQFVEEWRKERPYAPKRRS